MPRFFVSPEQISDGFVTLTGNDAFHISRSLRMAVGEHITVCDAQGHDYECVLSSFSDTVRAEIISSSDSVTEPPFKAILWQAIPKGEKLDSIIQKSVESGVYEINLFSSEHCIVKTDRASEEKKSERRNRISLESAKQCGRSIIPKVNATRPFSEMLREAKKADLCLFCYEADGTLPLGKIVNEFMSNADSTDKPTVSIVIGPEGGFSEAEAKEAKEAGLTLTGLGKRILRTESASPFVLASLVYAFELT